MQLHLACYRSAYVRPKHGWQWGIPEHWDRDNAVWDAFITERLHLLVKETGSRIRNTARLERTLLSGTLNAQMASLQTLSGPCCFLDNSPVRMDVPPDALFADSMQVWDMEMQVDDIIFHQDSAGKLLACVLEEGSFYGIVEMFIETAVVSHVLKPGESTLAISEVVPAHEMDQAPYM